MFLFPMSMGTVSEPLLFAAEICNSYSTALYWPQIQKEIQLIMTERDKGPDNNSHTWSGVLKPGVIWRTGASKPQRRHLLGSI